MKKLKSITHCVIAIAITMTSMNLGVFGALTTYANELTVGNDSNHPIKPMEELLTEEPINLVNPTVDSVLTQNIRERILNLNQPETEVEEADVELQPETEVEEADVAPQPETEVEEADVAPQPETEVEEADVAPQPETEVEESDVDSQLETEVEEAGVEPQPETEVEEADVEPQPETEVENFSLSKNIGGIYVYSVDKNQNVISQVTGSLDLAWYIVQNNDLDEVTVTFLEDYTITQKDLERLKNPFKADYVVITATSGVTVTVENDLEFYRDYYSTSSVDRKSITFENITFKFTDEHKIIANGLWLHMGQGVKMLGDKFPKIQLGSIVPFSGTVNNIPANWQISGHVYLFIESGEYSEIIVDSNSGGRLIEERSATYLFGGEVKELSYNKTENVKREHLVYLMGGQLLSAKDYENPLYSKINGLSILAITTHKQTINNYINISDLQIGEYQTPGILEINGELSFKSDGTIGMYEGSTLIINENASPITLFYGWIEENCTIVLPANKDKNNVPLTFESSFYVPQNTKLNISNKMTTDEFYLIRQKANPVDASNWIVTEDEEFYLEPREQDANGYYFKAKRKITDIIYDFDSNKMFYLDATGQERDADWFNDKFTNVSKDNIDISYEFLAKPDGVDYYILSPEPVTLKIRGRSSNKTFIINNNRTNREINIEFKGLNLTNSELKFENVNSITIDGENSITQDHTSTSPALTYSLASNQSRISFVNNGKFIVYSNDTLGEYQIKDQIINSSNSSITSDTSITQLSFEDGVTSDKSLQLYSLGSGSTKKFTAKTGYQKVSLLLPSDSHDYILCDASKTTCQPEDAYYYQRSNWTGHASQNSGPIGTRFTFTANTPANYYQVNNKPRVYVEVSQYSNQLYYISPTLKEAMENYVDHTHGTHEVIFLGNYNINSDADVNALEQYNNPTNGITFKTKVDDVKYILNVSKDLILEQYSGNRAYPVTFNQIKWEFDSDDRKVYANGRSLTFDSDVELAGTHAPNIRGGHPTTVGLLSKAQITIKSGAYTSVIGHHGNTANGSTVTLNISNGTFSKEIFGATDSASGNVIMTISGGTFSGEVSGATDSASGNVNMNISGGRFNGQVIGVHKSASGNVTLTISSGHFAVGQVYGAAQQTTGSVTMDILGGQFDREVAGATGSASGNVTLMIKNGTFNNQVKGSTENARGTVDMTVSGGTFQSSVTGSLANPTRVNLNISGGTFQSEVNGQISNNASNNSQININGQISIPTIQYYDLLSIGETTKSTLTITNQLSSNGRQDEKVKLQNESELRLEGNTQSSIKVLEVVDPNNTLTLSMNKSTAPLTVTERYAFNNNKLNLTPLNSVLGDGSPLIEFPNSTTDIGNFNFTNADYYMREINNNSGQKLVIYEKMDPSSITFKWDLNTNNFKYYLDGNGNSEENVWWNSIQLTDPTVIFDEGKLMMYKGTKIFKEPSSLTEINFELSGKTNDKNISITSGITTPWKLKLKDLNLTDSTINATNLKQIEITGNNIIKSLASSTPAFSYSFSNSTVSDKVITSNSQSNLVVYSSATDGISVTNPQGNVGQILSLSFDQQISQDEVVRLNELGNSSMAIDFSIPQNTKKMSILFGSSSSTRQYQLCHGTNSCTGSSLYVAGITDDTFKDSFEIQPNNQVTEYQYVRRANPVKTINVSVPSISFNINLGSATSNMVNNTNWQSYFSSNPIEMTNNSQSIKDEYTDSTGNKIHFGKTDANLEVEYNGVEKNSGSTMELVSPSDLDSPSNGVKVALNLIVENNNNDPIPLDEKSAVSNKIWTVNPASKLNLEIKPNFDNKDYFFRDYSTLTQSQANYKLKFKFNANP
ncbi:hypothetical protein [Turicibacter sanguinis]|uniref:hypothetical protein n=1 Tax=Turicibacter sanguinis TaxID=154288 RepID=UPI00232E7264|nr:hypothetical protein [Turicibacter sanguinis]MDB8550935.1 hypothetical protein [Turicibacter sanguinis]